MGTPLPCPPIKSGSDCPACTPGRWPSGETPKFVYVMFWKIINCGVSSYSAPNGHVFTLEQNPANICNWFWLGDTWHVFWDAKRIGPPQSRLRLLDVDGFSFFSDLSLQCPMEYWTYINDQNSCILMYAGARGGGTVWWNSKNNAVITSMGLDCGLGSFNETFRGPSSKITSKFNSLYQRTNLRIQLPFP